MDMECGEHCLTVCPKDGLTAVVRVEEVDTLTGTHKQVAWCSRFGPGEVTCAQGCLKQPPSEG